MKVKNNKKVVQSIDDTLAFLNERLDDNGKKKDKKEPKKLDKTAA